jgi:site-specific DNA recombinase
MPSAVIYARVSFRRQVEGTSLETQEAVCREWCAAQGYDVDKVFMDAGESAKTTDRPQFQLMLRYLASKRGKVAHLVVYKFDRFARNTDDDVVTRMRLKDIGVTLHSATERTDPTSAGRFLARVLAATAELDNENRAERSTNGMRSRVDAGRFMWTSPLGYVNSGRRGRGISLEPDPVKAPLVRRLFELMATGTYRQHEAIAKVNALGLKGRRGGPLTAWTAKKLLRNPAYCGRLEVPGWGKSARGDWTPLITEELFVRVQAVLDGTKETIAPRANNVTEARYPLRAFALCTVCNLPVTASESKGGSGKRFAYYHCHRARGHLRASAPKVEADFLSLLESLAPRPGQSGLMEAIFRRTWDAQKRDSVSDAQQLKAHLASLVKRKDNLMSQMEKGVLQDEDFAPRYREVTTAIHSVRDQLRVALENELDVDTAIDYLEHLLWNSAILWETNGLEGKQRIQRAIFPHGLKYSPATGFGTAVSSFFSVADGVETDRFGGVVRPERFELPTYCSGGNRSIQLSYGRAP